MTETKCRIHNKDCGEYTKCCLHDEKCGEYRRANPAISGIFDVSELSNSTKSHFESLKIQPDDEFLQEKLLIENRCGMTLNPGLFLCAYHRYTNGTGYKPKSTCMHPGHDQKKRVKVRIASINVVRYMNRSFKENFPVGGSLCHTHLKEMSEAQTRGNSLLTDDTIEETIETEFEDDANDEYIPEEMNLSEDMIQDISKQSEQLSFCLDVSPVVPVKKKKISDLGDRSLDGVKKKYQRMRKCFKEKFAQLAAPGQENDLLAMLSDSDDDGSDLPDELLKLKTRYDVSDAIGKLLILSLIDHDTHSYKTIESVFHCSRHTWKKAVALSKEPKFKLPDKIPFKRNRLNVSKCEHFLEYIFANGFVQDTAFGSRKLKFDAGNTQEIPRAILTCKYSHVIGAYLHACEMTDFDPVSESSLWRVLRELKPSQQKSLGGLDDIFAAGMTGFDTLQRLGKEMLPDSEPLVKDLDRGKRYLKTKYPSNCTNDSKIKTHNINFALSDPKFPKLAANHVATDDEVCNDCVQLWRAINEVDRLSKESTDINRYDVKNAIGDIKTYMSHLIRDVQQQKAKGCVFELLKGDSGAILWLKDYCQKIIPMKFREGQVDYFGKKGMTLHVDVIFRFENGEMKKYVYFTVMQRSDQDAEDVLALAKHILQKLKTDHPSVTTIYKKSDNASCYHNALGPEVLYWLCSEQDMSLVRYDFNEPCRGKDQCDRESANAKTILRSYLCAKNDVMTAEDIFHGLHYGYGLKDAEVSVAVNDKSKTKLEGTKMPNFTKYHSIKFNETGMELWRYFGIGPGIKVEYTTPTFECEGFEVIKEFSKTEQIQRVRGKVKQRKDRVLRNLFFCQVEGCSQIFEKERDYEVHCLVGNHDTVGGVKVTSMDLVKMSYINMMKMSAPKTQMMTNEDSCSSNMTTVCEEIEVMSSFREKGWALPVRAFFRFNDRQKKLLYNMFIAGEKTNKKFTAEQAVQEIRKKLPVEDFVKSKQVKALFSRWSKLYRQGQLNLTDLEMEEEDYNMVDEDAGAVAFNQHIQTQTTVLLDGAEQTDESILF